MTFPFLWIITASKCSHMCCSQTCCVCDLIFFMWMRLLSVLIRTNWIRSISLWLFDYSSLPRELTAPCAAELQAPGGAAGHTGVHRFLWGLRGRWWWRLPVSCWNAAAFDSERWEKHESSPSSLMTWKWSLSRHKCSCDSITVLCGEPFMFYCSSLIKHIWIRRWCLIFRRDHLKELNMVCEIHDLINELFAN